MGCTKSHSTIFSLQESDEKPKFSASHLPPDGFPLDESVFAVKSARNGKMGIGIEENTLRVGKYMNDLDAYLTVSFDDCSLTYI